MGFSFPMRFGLLNKFRGLSGRIETSEEAALDRDPAIATQGKLANLTCQRQVRF
jgi:hypothetical protein